MEGLRKAYRLVQDTLLEKERRLRETNDRLLAKRGEKLLLNIGGLVYWLNLPLVTKDKFAQVWTGPWRIVDRFGANCYKLALPSKAGGAFRIASYDQLRRYEARHDFLPEESTPVAVADPTLARPESTIALPLWNLLPILLL